MGSTNGPADKELRKPTSKGEDNQMEMLGGGFR